MLEADYKTKSSQRWPNIPVLYFESAKSYWYCLETEKKTNTVRIFSFGILAPLVPRMKDLITKYAVPHDLSNCLHQATFKTLYVRRISGGDTLPLVLYIRRRYFSDGRR